MIKWLKKLFNKKYILRIRTLDNEYCDPVDLLLEASFEILVRFIEEDTVTNPIVDWYGKTVDKSTITKEEVTFFKETSKIRDEIQFLYKWWTKRDITRNEAWDSVPKCKTIFRDKNSLLIDTHGALIKENDPDCTEEIKKYLKALQAIPQEKWEEEDTEMLIRLMKVRPYLWT